jgi:hypothetical protein
MSCRLTPADREPALVRRNAHGEHDQGQRVGEQRRPNGHRDRLEPIRADLCDDRKPEERVRREQRSHHDRCDKVVAEDEGDDRSEEQRDRRRHETEPEGPGPRLAELREIDLDAADEHEQQHPQVRYEIHNRPLLAENRKDMGPDDDPAQERCHDDREPNAT